MEAERLLYGANIDHAERFAGAEGAGRLAMIVTMYGIEPDQSLMIGDGLIWHKDGKRTIARQFDVSIKAGSWRARQGFDLRGAR